MVRRLEHSPANGARLHDVEPSRSLICWYRSPRRGAVRSVVVRLVSRGPFVRGRRAAGPSPGRRSMVLSRVALTATTIVETLIRSAPTAGGSSDAGPRERTGGERDRDDVVPGGPAEVLDHLPVARLREPDARRPRRADRRSRARRRPTRSRRRCRRRSRCRRRRGRAPARRSRRRRPSRPRALAPGARRPLASLSSGSTSANTSSMPRSAPTASATCRASPVIITTRTPIVVQRANRLGATRAGSRPRARARR